MPQNNMASKVEGLNEWYRRHSAFTVLDHALKRPDAGKIALVSSFGAEAVVLLHMISVTKPDTPVLFIDTELLFAETLVYQQDLAERLALRDVRVIRADAARVKEVDPYTRLHLSDTDACCALRKTEPLQRALDGFDGWITGRKRFHGGDRAALEFFETEPDTGRMKINPLAHWTREDVQTYMEENRLPRHPLISKGYASVGCMPCTSPVKDGEDVRAGRWRGSEKTECGIHFDNGKLKKTGVNA